MSLNFVQLCEDVFNDLDILEEADKSVLNRISREAYRAYIAKKNAKTPEEAKNQVQELFRLRNEYIEELKEPGLYTTPEQRTKLAAMSDQDVENIIKSKAASEVHDVQRVHGTHFLTLDYLSQYTGLNK